MKNNQTKFKETETLLRQGYEGQVGPIPEEWDVLDFGKAVDINPKRPIKKGSNVKFVAMTNIEPFNKRVISFSKRNFIGGAKFKNGDTLMARITPCLENGKTAFVDYLEKDEIAGGSTEFIVISGKKNISDSNFTYYLTISPIIRAAAIKAMTGTSGRQRVESDKLEKQLVGLPPIKEQKRIAEILGALDEKIELNRRMNDNLEKIASAIFKHWFVDFALPAEALAKAGRLLIDKLPDGWKIGKLNDLVENISDRYCGDNEIDKYPYVPIDIISSKKLMLSSVADYHEAKSSLIKFKENDILFGAMRAYFHKVSIAPFEGLTRTTCFVLRPKKPDFLYYSLLLINQKETIDYASNNSEGSTIPYAKWNNSLALMPIIIPNDSLLKEFNKLVFPIIEKIKTSHFEQRELQQIRDSLLPRLMSGKIRV